jgi:hypothetical protein
MGSYTEDTGHAGARQRDGPVKDQQPIAVPKRAHAAPSDPPAHSWDWRSKGN